jgi:hypothetical protein
MIVTIASPARFPDKTPMSCLKRTKFNIGAKNPLATNICSIALNE